MIKIPMESVQSVAVLALCNTGSRYESPQQFGIAHFFEHMVFKGTQKYHSSQDLASAVDSVGANFNALTSKEYTGYYVQAASRHLDFALDVVSDMLLTPRLRQVDIDREKGVIVEELNMYVDTPQHHIANLFEEMVFDGSGLSHNIVGLKETILSFKSSDFQHFLEQWYGPDNLVVCVAGDERVIKSSKLEDQVREMFSKKDFQGKKRGRSQGTRQLSPGPISSAKKLHVEYRKTEQAHFIAGWPGITRHDPDRFGTTTYWCKSNCRASRHQKKFSLYL